MTEPQLPPPEPRKPRHAALWAALVLALAAAGVWWFYFHNANNTAGRTAPPLPVTVVPAATGDMPISFTALGTVTPLASVTVQSQISGYLASVAFHEGQEVNAGDVLAQIDPRTYQAALDQAEGQLARDQAQLDGARVDLKRYAALMKQDSIAKQTYDDQSATVRQLEGTVKLDQGTVDTARVNLNYCRIVAPIAGRLGLRQIDPGNYVTPSSTTGLVVINQMRPISVIFSLPSDDLPPVMKQTRAGLTLAVAAFDRAGLTKIADGTLASFDNGIDVTTGTFKLRASFANEDEALYPNQFVNIRLTVDTLKDAVVIPVSAVQRGSPGTFVYVVQSDNTVAVRAVKLGPGAGERVAVTDGLAVGEPIVTDGADKLKQGAKVAPRPAAAQATGAPADTPPPPAPGQP